MMGMYAQKFRMRRYGGSGRDSPPTIGHDRVNYINPTINYDKFPRKIRPKRGRSANGSENSLSSPGNRSRRCSCLENLNLTSEQLTALRRHSDHSREDEDGLLLQQQQQTDEILHASADVLTRMFTCLNTNAEPPPKNTTLSDPRYTSRPRDKPEAYSPK
ncbi:hypothetical protein E2C01_070468 [Portunus trituberculatus]|uniref:Uncharacterized protein n=2 Tax=Portunus trituberculatus TaxID=210409 RepID=A0A5B7I3K7_PORTR|nr:hypothetical protein [Portunus trituberculatus]